MEGGGGGSVGHWDRSGEGSGIRGGSSEFRGRPIARLNRIGNLRASVEEFLEFARRGSANGTPLEVVSGGRFSSALEGPKADATETPHFPKEPEVLGTPSNFFGALRAQRGFRSWWTLVVGSGQTYRFDSRRNSPPKSIGVRYRLGGGLRPPHPPLLASGGGRAPPTHIFTPKECAKNAPGRPMNQRFPYCLYLYP